jgi:GNAT superfamily N-acetyltransferase
MRSLTAELGYERTPGEIRAWIHQRRSDQVAFVARFNGEVVGWIEAAVEHRVQSPPYVLIGGLVVSQQVRGGGIGRQLCGRVEAWSSDRGVNTVRVTSRSTRAEAHRFYLQNGYETVKTSMVFEKRVRNNNGPETEVQGREKVDPN